MEGLRSMAQRQEEELEPKRQQYSYVSNTKVDKIRRLVDELADFNGGAVKTVIKEKLNQMETELDLLLEEKAKLEVELTEFEVNPEAEGRILKLAAIDRKQHLVIALSP